jgi:hypothetical protein
MEAWHRHARDVEQGPNPIEDVVTRARQPDRRLADRRRRQDRVITGSDPIEGGATLAGEIIGVAQSLRRHAGAVFHLGLEVVVQQMPGAAVFAEERRPGLGKCNGFVRIDQPVKPGVELQVFAARARSGQDLCASSKRRPGFRRGLLEHRRRADRDPQFLRRRCRKRGVDDLKQLGYGGQIGDRPGIPADRVERQRGELGALTADRSPARLQRKYSAERGRSDQRPAGLRAERERDLEVGDRRRRPARRAARGPAAVVRVRGRRLASSGGKFDGLGLAQNDGAGSTQHGDAGGVLTGLVAAVDRRVVLGRQIRRIDHVLNADRDAVERVERAIPGKRPVPLACFG